LLKQLFLQERSLCIGCRAGLLSKLTRLLCPHLRANCERGETQYKEDESARQNECCSSPAANVSFELLDARLWVSHIRLQLSLFPQFRWRLKEASARAATALVTPSLPTPEGMSGTKLALPG